ncbi:MAG TPA: DUF2141 domain-containing protein [Allosphingosinicella sp.]|nr:DUF2141 domain-containing protein [Allosphingosinicella sp.]
MSKLPETAGRAFVLTGAAFISVGAAAPPSIEVALAGLRNTRGMVHLCMTKSPAHFPNCGDDPGAVKRSVPATGTARIDFSNIVPGSYALSVIHDENRNGRLDTLLGIPREGFGFSRNPVIRFGPPRFAQVRFDAGSGLSRQNVRMQYLL